MVSYIKNFGESDGVIILIRNARFPLEKLLLKSSFLAKRTISIALFESKSYFITKHTNFFT